ncbi:MAG TPA: O-antigen ligase family protein [Dyella sp.]|uniref:O-antigen ligase family protein n=1 Tax=Dyella sp. TaxID=1869338 RepID=UPI002B5FF0DC|nr:O-antigen ligase family protein [Dyella sp.]HTV86172.1 O-antigen ligase family protein [Dyella sp.]
MQLKESKMSAVRGQRLHLQADVPQWVGRWLLLGMWWLLVGLAASPVGEKVWNPGKPYHDSLVVLFIAPAVWWVWKRRGEFGRRLVGGIDGCLLLVFLAWASLSAVWANYGHVGDMVFNALYILLFVVVWAALVAGNPQWFRQLLFWAAMGLALVALGAITVFPSRVLHTLSWQEEGRLVAFGALDNPNLAAFAYGAAIVWLAQSAVRERYKHVLQVLALIAMAAFVVVTYCRSAWLAILVAQGCMLVAARHGHVRLRALAILVVSGLAVAFGGWRYVAERGMSYRAQILEQAWGWIKMHPWRGLGEGSHYTIQVADQTWTHSHNAFTHNAIMLGIPGALVWVALWLIVGWRGWLFRHISAGRCLLALWVFATVAFQFDAPELMQKPSVEWFLGWLPVAMSMGLAWRVQDSRRTRGTEVRA